MTKQFADNWESKTRASADTGVGVTQVVNADTFEVGTLRYSAPGPVEVGARFLGTITSDNVVTKTGEGIVRVNKLEPPGEVS